MPFSRDVRASSAGRADRPRTPSHSTGSTSSVRDLAAGVHPGIRAPGDDEAHRVGATQEHGQGRGEGSLDRAEAGLGGPSGERRPVVGEVDPDPQRHRASVVRATTDDPCPVGVARGSGAARGPPCPGDRPDPHGPARGPHPPRRHRRGLPRAGPALHLADPAPAAAQGAVRPRGAAARGADAPARPARRRRLGRRRAAGAAPGQRTGPPGRARPARRRDGARRARRARLRSPAAARRRHGGLRARPRRQRRRVQHAGRLGRARPRPPGAAVVPRRLDRRRARRDPRARSPSPASASPPAPLALAVLPLALLAAPFVRHDHGSDATAADPAAVGVRWRTVVLVGLGLVVFYAVDTAVTAWGPVYLSSDAVFTDPPTSPSMYALATLPYLVAILLARAVGDAVHGTLRRPDRRPPRRPHGVRRARGPRPRTGRGLAGRGRGVLRRRARGGGHRAAVVLGGRPGRRRGAPTRCGTGSGSTRSSPGSTSSTTPARCIGSVLTGVVGTSTLRLGYAVPMVLVLGLLPLARHFATVGDH